MATGALYRFLFDYETNTLMKNNYIVWGIVISYVLFVKFLGPEMMKNKKPMTLQTTLVLFNAFLVVCNAYMCVNLTYLCIKFWNVRCNAKYNPEFPIVMNEYGYLGWHALLLKIIELLDTVIFILRKKYNQASVLHVSHHALVVLFYWTLLRERQLGYYCLLVGSINSAMHVFTYIYYGMSAMGPNVRKYLWWKKYLSMIQIAQFFIGMSYIIYSVITGCENIGFVEKCAITCFMFVLVLLFNFYLKTYRKKEQKHCM